MRGKGMKYLPERISPDYERQQKAILDVCFELGLKPFYPEYHGDTGDKNTVLVYLPEDEEFNKELEKNGYYPYTPIRGSSYAYKPPIWTFENSDVNGMGNYGFANFGRIDLRYSDFKERIRGSIQFNLCKRKEKEIVSSAGGFLGLKEADEEYNGNNEEMLKAFNLWHGRSFTGKINYPEDERKKITDGEMSIFSPFVPDENHFGIGYIVPREDETLARFVKDWLDGKGPATEILDIIYRRIEQIGGVVLIWK